MKLNQLLPAKGSADPLDPDRFQAWLATLPAERPGVAAQALMNELLRLRGTNSRTRLKLFEASLDSVNRQVREAEKQLAASPLPLEQEVQLMFLAINALLKTMAAGYAGIVDEIGHKWIGFGFAKPLRLATVRAMEFQAQRLDLAYPQSAIVGTGGSFAPWSYRVDFTSVASTAGIVVGLGNFGHNVSSYPGYRMTAYNKQGGIMSLASFGMLGSCDHTWTPTGQQFNDDLALNLSNGNFVVTPVAGLNNTNSDILLMAMPSNLGWLDVTTLGPSAGDSVNVVIAVPAPGAASLLGMVGLLATRRRR